MASAVGGEIVPYGESVEGRELRAVRVPGSSPGLPRVLCCANIHGPEFIGNRVATAFLAELANDHRGKHWRLRDRSEVWVAPCLNPDGYARTWSTAGFDNFQRLRTNARGVDLNRNFPLPPGKRRLHVPWAGSTVPGATTFIGPAPLSEPETAGLDALLKTGDFHASANLHSFMGTLIPPCLSAWDHYKTYKRLCAAYSSAQPGVRYRRLSSFVFDTYTGEQEDHQHHNRKTWALCVEVFPVGRSFRQHLRAPSVFWRFNPQNPDLWCANEIPALYAFFDASLQMPRPGTIPRSLMA